MAGELALARLMGVMAQALPTQVKPKPEEDNYEDALGALRSGTQPAADKPAKDAAARDNKGGKTETEFKPGTRMGARTGVGVWPYADHGTNRPESAKGYEAPDFSDTTTPSNGTIPFDSSSSTIPFDSTSGALLQTIRSALSVVGDTNLKSRTRGVFDFSLIIDRQSAEGFVAGGELLFMYSVGEKPEVVNDQSKNGDMYGFFAGGRLGYAKGRLQFMLGLMLGDNYYKGKWFMGESKIQRDRNMLSLAPYLEFDLLIVKSSSFYLSWSTRVQAMTPLMKWNTIANMENNWGGTDGVDITTGVMGLFDL